MTINFTTQLIAIVTIGCVNSFSMFLMVSERDEGNSGNIFDEKCCKLMSPMHKFRFTDRQRRGGKGVIMCHGSPNRWDWEGNNLANGDWDSQTRKVMRNQAETTRNQWGLVSNNKKTLFSDQMNNKWGSQILDININRMLDLERSSVLKT